MAFDMKSIVKVKIVMHKGIQSKKSNAIISDSVSAYNCQPKAVNATVKRFSDIWVGPMKKALNELSTKYYKLSFQWGDSGWRCISTKNFIVLRDKVIKANAIAEQTVNHIRNHWPQVVDDSKKVMGSLYNSADFVNPDYIFRNVGATILREAMPNDNADELRSFMGDVADDIIQQQRELAEENVKQVQNELLDRILEKLNTLKSRMSDEDQNRKHYKIVVEQVKELCDNDSFNITDNKQIQVVTEKIQKQFEKLDGDAIRSNSFVRQAVTQSTDSFIGQLSSMKLE